MSYRALREKLYWNNHGICAICKEKISSIEDSSIDHRKPKSLGGKDHPSNLRITHRHCNGARGNDWSGRGQVRK